MVCVVGDGGFAHVWSELETARRMGIKVTLVVINNGILGFQKHAETVKFGAPPHQRGRPSATFAPMSPS